MSNQSLDNDRSAIPTGDQRPSIAEPHMRGHVRATIAVLKELGIYEKCSAGCIAMCADHIARETAYPDMLAALIQITSRADKDLQEHFDERTSECARDYAMCIAAIAKATGAQS